MDQECAMSDVTWWKRGQSGGWRDEPVRGREIPGDTNASDIVGRTGEEMPEVAHDDGELDHPLAPDEPSDDEPALPPEADTFER
jgi:hypothetical protein